jgi:putative transposase
MMPTGKWFVCLSVEIEDTPLPHWKGGSVVRIDVGLESLATLSNGEKIANPRFFREEKKELARVQRKHSNASIGTPARRKPSTWLSESMKESLICETISPIRLAVD